MDPGRFIAGSLDAGFPINGQHAWALIVACARLGLGSCLCDAVQQVALLVSSGGYRRVNVPRAIL